MKINVTERHTVPVAFVTKNRQRIKQYNNNSTVYLNNGDEFEIELFNPTSSKVMAKIDLNGVSIGPGVVLRPGERVFLERYINDAKKFLFSTYEVDGDNPDVQRAIANNGDVYVKFYCEEVPLSWPTYWTTSITTPWCGNTWTTNTGGVGNHSYYSSSTTGTKVGQIRGNRKLSKKTNMDYAPFSDRYGDVQGQCQTQSMNFMNSTMDYSPESMSLGIVDEPKSIETGRIEKGSNSNQSFGYDHSNFNTYWTWCTKWKILPASQKPIMKEDIKVFCGSCGSKRRKESHKFCPQCGTRY